MLAVFAFFLVMVGAINWFCIGLLQFDFVAGLFGSQASIFSRIIYVAVGVSALVILYVLIKNKGKVVFNLSRFKARFSKRKENELNEQPSLVKATNSNMESGADNSLQSNNSSLNNNSSSNLNSNSNMEASTDNNLSSNKSNNSQNEQSKKE